MFFLNALTVGCAYGNIKLQIDKRFFVVFTKKIKNVERVTQIDIIEERPFYEIWVSWKDFKSQPN